MVAFVLQNYKPAQIAAHPLNPRYFSAPTNFISKAERFVRHGTHCVRSVRAPHRNTTACRQRIVHPSGRLSSFCRASRNDWLDARNWSSVFCQLAAVASEGAAGKLRSSSRPARQPPSRLAATFSQNAMCPTISQMLWALANGPRSRLFRRNAIQNLPDGVAMPGVTVHDAVIVIENALHFSHSVLLTSKHYITG